MKRNQQLLRRATPRLEALEDRCLLSAGVLDTTFGSGGLVTTSLGINNASYDYSVAIYHNQGAANESKIVAAGTFLSSASHWDQDVGVVRYNLDGSLDKSFGGSGEVTTSFGSGGDGAHDVKIQPDGKVVVAGWTGGAGSDFAVVRYNADGSLDTTFGTGGKAITDINRGGDVAYTMGLQPDGRIVLAGTTTPKNTSNVDLAVVRYNADGGLDTSFGTGGKVTRHFAFPLAANVHGGMDMVIDSSTNKVVVVAQLTQDPLVVVRLNTNGSPDASFGSNGAGYVSFGTQKRGNIRHPLFVIETRGLQLPSARPSSRSSHSASNIPRMSWDGLASIGRERLPVE
jgi:uncharacterized delta-60 repeat protein